MLAMLVRASTPLFAMPAPQGYDGLVTRPSVSVRNGLVASVPQDGQMVVTKLGSATKKAASLRSGLLIIEQPING